MGLEFTDKSDGPLVFAGEETRGRWEAAPEVSDKDRWKILVVDDEEEVHEITRITLKGFCFDGRGLSLISAYTGGEVREIMANEPDIAMILLDVVMEEDDTGLQLVEYIRKTLNNSKVRIVLRTGQPGKAPEHNVISKYDINEYKTKPEFTAQKLFTSVISCLRAYQSLKTIERNREGLEAIIRSTSLVFKNKSFRAFGHQVLEQLDQILRLDEDKGISGAYFVGFPAGKVLMIAGNGEYKDLDGTPIEAILPESVSGVYDGMFARGGEQFLDDAYIGVFKTKEGFTSALYLKKAELLSSEEQYLLRIYANN
ncbi:MAG: DUF3369 domain-containing protein, partial [Desulfobacterales bacterium]|nr:DUF3369 domain-containing protein [Desulfobacterales bacterium]